MFETAALQLVDPDRAFVEIDELPAHPERFGLAEPEAECYGPPRAVAHVSRHAQHRLRVFAG